MPSLKSIRKRIVSVRNTQKITKAMKMVAAAKLRRAQEAVVAMRPYARRMKTVTQDLVSRVDEEQLRDVENESEEEHGDLTRLLQLTDPAGGEKRIRVLAITSDRGLAGAFNSNVNRRTERFFVERQGAELSVTVVGKKGREHLKRRKLNIAADFAGVDPKTALGRAAELRAHVMDAVLGGQVDAVYVIYNEFKSAATQTIKVERLLPLKAPPAAQDPDEGPRQLTDFVYEPSQEEVLRHLIPLQIETELGRILLEGIASFMGSQMTAMDNASRNAKQMIGRLTLQYNRARQAAITKELMEIVGGAEALKG